jgi:hypothetical protein
MNRMASEGMSLITKMKGWSARKTGSGPRERVIALMAAAEI